MTATRGHCPQCHRPATLHDDHPTCDDCAAWEMDRTHGDDGTMSRGGCILTLLAVAWVLLAATAWSAGAPMWLSVIYTVLAVAVASVTLAGWSDYA